MRNVLENEIFLVFFLYLSLLGFLSVRSFNAQTYFFYLFRSISVLGPADFACLSFFMNQEFVFFGPIFLLVLVHLLLFGLSLSAVQAEKTLRSLICASLLIVWHF